MMFTLLLDRDSDRPISVSKVEQRIWPADTGCPGWPALSQWCPVLSRVYRLCQHMVSCFYISSTHTAFSALTLLVGRQEGHLACKKTKWWGSGVVIRLERGADLPMAQLMPLPLTASFFCKIQIVLPFWYWLTWVVPDKGPLNGCMYVWSTHRHLFNGPFSGTTQVSPYQKDKTNLDFTEARDSEWQWHQLGHMQVCTLLQTDNPASTPPLAFCRWVPFLPPNQQPQSTEGSTTSSIR